MKTTSNNIIRRGSAFLILIVVLAAVFAIGLIRSGKKIFKKEQFPEEIVVDDIEDQRGLGYSGQRKVVFDKKNNIYVAYRKNYERNEEIFVSRISAKDGIADVAATESPIAVIDEGNDQRVPSIDIDAKDDLHVVWYGSDTGGQKNNRQIKYTRSADNAESWSSWRNIAYVSGYKESDELWQEHPTLLAGKDNTLYVAWEGKDEQNSKQQIKFIKSVDGGNIWTKWKNIRVTKDSTQSRPTLVEDAEGKLHLFMYSSQGNENNTVQIQYAVSSDKGDSWSQWQLISNANYDSRHVSATVDSQGKVHVVWRSQIEKDGPTQIIYRSLFNGQWSKRFVVWQSSRNEFFPSIGAVKAKDGNEVMLVSWLETAEKSDFPNDDPQNGTVFWTFIKGESVQKPATFEDQVQDNDLYPSVPAKENDKSMPVVLLAERSGNNTFAVKLKFLGRPK